MSSLTMLAPCIADRGTDLGAPRRGNFYTPSTRFDVSVGAEYRIFGLGLFDGVLLALVHDDTQLPNWLPVGLFELRAQKCPAGWEFEVSDGPAASGGEDRDRWMAKWGYPELISNPRHSDDLVERDATALEIFFGVLRAESSSHS